MHIIYLDHIYFPFLSLWSPVYSTPRHFPHNPCSYFVPTESTKYCLYCAGMEPTTEAHIAFQGTMAPKKTYFPSPGRCQLPTGLQLRRWLPEPLHSHCYDLGSLIHMHAVTAAVSSCVQWPCCVWKALFCCSQLTHLAVTVFPFLFQYEPGTLWERGMTCMPF